jgi:hypothetical protein
MAIAADLDVVFGELANALVQPPDSSTDCARE